MKDRFFTLIVALLALLLSWILLLPHSSEEISLPTTENHGEEGFKGLFEWLTKIGVPVVSLRNRYATLLDSTQYSDRGNLLIVSLPHRNNQSAQEWVQLANWLQKGNNILILAAEFHLPAWGAGSKWQTQFNQLGQGLGWKMKTYSIDSERQQNTTEQPEVNLSEQLQRMSETLDSIKPQLVTVIPAAKIPVMQGIGQLEGHSSSVLRNNSYSFTSELDEDLVTIPMAQIIENPESIQSSNFKTVMFLLPARQGNIYLSLIPDFFSNENLGKSDNAPLIFNLINNSLSHNGKVIFDDYHFGLSELYDKTHFFSDSRLHNTFLFIAVFWLVYVVGYTNRLVPVRQKLRLPAEIDYVKAMSGFFESRINRRTLARELVKHLVLDIQLKYHLNTEKKAWIWLQQNPVLTHLNIALLAQGQSGIKVNPHELNDNINAIRKLLL